MPWQEVNSQSSIKQLLFHINKTHIFLGGSFFTVALVTLACGLSYAHVSLVQDDRHSDVQCQLQKHLTLTL